MADQHHPPGTICPQCGALSPYSDEYCDECGARLASAAVCPGCGEQNPPGESFCGSCGRPLSQSRAATPVAPPVTTETDGQQAGGVPEAGKGPQNYLVPAVIAVVILGLVGAVAVIGFPGPAAIGGNTTANAAPSGTQLSSAFAGDWQVGSGQNGTPAPTLVATTAGSAPVASTAGTQATAAQAAAVLADFKTDTTTGSIPLTVSFSDASTGAPDTWYWDFGDGTYSTEKNPVHTFTTEGSFTVTLRVDRDGQTSSKSRAISASSAPPVANFVADTTSGYAPLTVKFTDTSTGSPTTWFWEFANGQISYDRNPEMTYQSPGTYVVQLTVERGGVKSKKNGEITVLSAPSVTARATIAVSTTGLSAGTVFTGTQAAGTVTQATITTQATASPVRTAPQTTIKTQIATSAATAAPKTTVSAATTTASAAKGSFEGEWRDTSGTYFWFQQPEGDRIRGGWEFGEIAGEDSGSFTGTLSNGGSSVSGSFETMFQGGVFSFTLTDSNHLSGYMDSPSGKTSVKCTRM